MTAARWITLAGGLVVAVLALGTGYALRLAMDGRDPTAAVATELGAPFALVDHRGRPITEAAFEGRPSLLFFGFTHCPEVCPTTVYDMETWLTELDVGTDEMGAFFVTVDPERDRPDHLAAYLEPQSERITGITGPPEAVWDMARSWRVYWQKRPLGEGDYTLDHFASIFVLDRQGRVVDLIGYGAEPAEAKRKIARALDG